MFQDVSNLNDKRNEKVYEWGFSVIQITFVIGVAIDWRKQEITGALI